ncbi:MAG TPA: inositol monophosphatase family protein [Streptosporangiaceae bacterium]
MSAPAAGGLLELACTVALAAGQLLVSRDVRATVVATKSSPTDVVTEADQAAEALIRERIGAVRPADRILGEEGGEAPAGPGPAEGEGWEGEGGEGGATSVRWIVDPLDGTVNYLYGLPDWAVSVAAEEAGTVVAGAVFVPRRGELFSGALGQGAWLRSAGPVGPGGNDVPAVRLTCNRDVPISHALVATGFGYEEGQRLVQAEVLRGVLPRVRDIRRGGSCAVDLCSLASGRVDAFYERGVNLWDIAAGGLIAAEAGALVTGLHGRQASPSMTLAAPPPLHGELHDLLASLNPERDG